MFKRRSNGRFCDRINKSADAKKAIHKRGDATGIDGAYAGKSVLAWEHRKQNK